MIKRTLRACLVVRVALMAGVAFAQQQDTDGHGHSDIEFLYEDGAIIVERGAHGMVFASNFSLDGVDRQFTREPGFSSELEEGLGLNAEDQIVYNVLDNLLYWNNGFHKVPDGAQIRIVNRPPAPTVPDTIVTAISGVQRGAFDSVRNRIGEADADGDFHHDLQMFFEPNSAPDALPEELYGAYGIKLSLSSNAVGLDESHPFFIVFNVGLPDQQFDEALAAYAIAVPEAATNVLACCGLMCIAAFGRGNRRERRDCRSVRQ
jgi:hypothetical protein